MLLVGAMGARAAEAYCYFKPSDGSLNFCYNDSRQSWINQGYSTYNLNTGSNSPSWSLKFFILENLYFRIIFHFYDSIL